MLNTLHEPLVPTQEINNVPAQEINSNGENAENLILVLTKIGNNNNITESIYYEYYSKDKNILGKNNDIQEVNILSSDEVIYWLSKLSELKLKLGINMNNLVEEE